MQKNKGITLIALILTIVVLLILAVVAINAVKSDGIIAHAKNARSTYETKSAEENELLQKLAEQMEAVGKVKDNLNKIINEDANTKLTDEYENKITVPAGFKILVDSTTGYTADTIDVTKGIVVEDGEGNQFVWIPVGTIYTNAQKTESKTITLGRYANFTKTNNAYTVAQVASDYANQVDISNCKEDTQGKHDANLQNEIANNIGEFYTKTFASGGYYIGRYEARCEEKRSDAYVQNNSTPSITLKASDNVCNYILQKYAAYACKNMYTDKTYKSDLVNSYAWDTAIIFFQEFGNNQTYSTQTSVNSSFAETGTSGTNTKDVICNVYDMASNCYEWTTETYYISNNELCCVMRGGSVANTSAYTASSRNPRKYPSWYGC